MRPVLAPGVLYLCNALAALLARLTSNERLDGR